MWIVHFNFLTHIFVLCKGNQQGKNCIVWSKPLCFYCACDNKLLEILTSRVHTFQLHSQTIKFIVRFNAVLEKSVSPGKVLVQVCNHVNSKTRWNETLNQWICIKWAATECVAKCQGTVTSHRKSWVSFLTDMSVFNCWTSNNRPRCFLTYHWYHP